MTSLFLGRQCRWWEIFQPCSGSSSNLALGQLGSSSLLSWALCVTLSSGLAQSLHWCPHCKQPPPAQGQGHSGQEGCLVTWAPHRYGEGPTYPSWEPQQEAGVQSPPLLLLLCVTWNGHCSAQVSERALGREGHTETWPLLLQINSSGCQPRDCVMLLLYLEDAWGSSRDKQQGSPQNRNPSTDEGDCWGKKYFPALAALFISSSTSLKRNLLNTKLVQNEKPNQNNNKPTSHPSYRTKITSI